MVGIRLFRSCIFAPADRMRVLQKSLILPNDCTVVDLEDAIAPSKKDEARDNVLSFLATPEMATKDANKSILLRVNCPITTPWGKDDLAAVEKVIGASRGDGLHGIAGVVLPKVDTPDVVQGLKDFPLPIWAMIETAKGVINADAIAAEANLDGLIFGLNDFTKDIQARHTRERGPLMYAMSRCIIAARAHGKYAIDGVHMDIEDHEALEFTSLQGRDLGFDGRSLIHPNHIAITNAAYSPSEEEIAQARKLIEKYAEAEEAGKGVVVVDDTLIEKLHVEQAQLVLEKARQMGL
jgi:citrate lyase beta subunit